MGVVSYTEDDLERWQENIRLLKDDFARVDADLRAGVALAAEERLKAVSVVAERLRKRLDDLEAAATHPWVSAAHRSLVEQSRADVLRIQLEELRSKSQSEQDARRNEVISLLESNASLRRQIDECRKELKEARKAVRAEHDASMRFVQGVKPLKGH